MGISPDEFVARFPLIWHMAEDGTWASIQRFGLRSTSSLLDLYEITGTKREHIESCHRPSSVLLRAKGLPEAVIRDQAPINEAVLASVLDDGLTPADWYRILNSRVFFWVTESRLERLLEARLYRARPHTVVAVDSRRLLERNLDRVTLSPINSGNTMMVAMRRGLQTFLPLHQYPFQERRGQGKVPVVELAVEGMVADIEKVTVRVEHRAPGAQPVQLWPI